MICLIFLSPKVREGSVGGPQAPAWICHSAAFRPHHRYSPASADYPTFQSVPPLLLSPHKLPRTFSPVCFAPFSEFHHTTPLQSHLLPPPSPDKQSPAEQMTSLITISLCSLLHRSLFSISDSDRMSVCQPVKYNFVSCQTSAGRGTHA